MHRIQLAPQEFELKAKPIQILENSFMHLPCLRFQNRSSFNENVPALHVTTPKCSRVPIWGPDSGPKNGPHSMSTNSWWTPQEHQILVHQTDLISNRFPKGCWDECTWIDGNGKQKLSVAFQLVASFLQKNVVNNKRET